MKKQNYSSDFLELLEILELLDQRKSFGLGCLGFNCLVWFWLYEKQFQRTENVQ